jgi:Copper binding proteins, plastocyanin/azurin family
MQARRILVVGAVAAALFAACGDDDDTAGTTVAPAPTTERVDSSSVASAAGSTPGSANEGTLPVPDEICALAKQMDQQDDFPSDAQLQKYKELAPDEIKDDVNKAADALIDAPDPVAQFNAAGSDDVEAAIAKINAWEEANCGIKHSEEDALPPGATKEKEDGAQQVTVAAREYSFDLPADIKAGRTTFTLDNQGQEAHVLVVFKLAEGATLDQAMQSESGEGVDTSWSSDIAARGEKEALTFDLEPGHYGLVCFIPDANGQPHFMLGMQKEFTVS